MRHCVRYWIGELPTKCAKRSASTDLELPAVRASSSSVHARQPTGATLALFVHVQAQDLDEQHLGQFGQHPGAAGSG